MTTDQTFTHIYAFQLASSSLSTLRKQQLLAIWPPRTQAPKTDFIKLPKSKEVSALELENQSMFLHSTILWLAMGKWAMPMNGQGSHSHCHTIQNSWLQNPALYLAANERHCNGISSNTANSYVHCWTILSPTRDAIFSFSNLISCSLPSNSCCVDWLSLLVSSSLCVNSDTLCW